MQSVVRSDMAIPEPEEERWSDFVDDLWDRKLPHFRRKGYVYSNSPSSPVVKTPEETPHSSKMVNELIHYSSEINMLELMDEDEGAAAAPSQDPTPSEPGTKEYVADTQPKLVTKLDKNELEMAKQLSVEDIVKFLQHVKLEQYATIFEEFEINGELLIQLPDNELQDMGIVSAIDRLKISVYFRQYISGIKDIPSQQSVEEVVKFLEDNKPLRQFASRFGENKIDVQLLLSASDEVMRELGVDTGVHVRLIRTKFKKLTAEIPL